jgi:hypothetical protein
MVLGFLCVAANCAEGRQARNPRLEAAVKASSTFSCLHSSSCLKENIICDADHR